MARAEVQKLIDRMAIPVIAAPMFLVSNPALTLACCGEGIMGSFPAHGTRSREEFQTWLDEMEVGIKRLEDAGRKPAPWAVNLVVHASNPRYQGDLELVEKYKVTVMFTAPTAIRVLKKQDPKYLSQYDLSSLRALFLAGEPLDEPTAQWIAQALGKPIIDNYWQTESGWPILTIANGVAPQASKFGSPGVAMYGYDVKLIDEATGAELTGVNEKGLLAIEGPLPPGCAQTIWRDDARFVRTYWNSVPGRQIYSTFDWAVRDADGYYFILGRTDDVINVAGHRLGTREIEESIASHASVAEVAVVGVADQLRGQVAMAFVVPRSAALVADEPMRLALEGAIMKRVDEQLGAVARPSRVRFVTVLPKTRSGKLLRRAIQAVCEARDPGDLTTIEDPTALQQIRDLMVR